MKELFRKLFKKKKYSMSSYSKESVDRSKDFFDVVDKLHRLKVKNEEINLLLKFLDFLDEIDSTNDRNDIANIVNNKRNDINSLLLKII